jgi:hypothetical protein
MPVSKTVKDLVRTVGDDPDLVDVLIEANPPVGRGRNAAPTEARKKLLNEIGVANPDTPALKRPKLAEEIEELLLDAARKEGAQVGSPERLVEWVGAIAAAAAGAMAA